MLKINKSKVIIARWESITGCSSTHQEEPAICLTCPGEPLYSEVCRVENHKRQQVKHRTETERAPEERKALRNLYSGIRSKLAALGFHAGGPVFFLAQTVDVEAVTAEIREQINKANADWNVCRADIDLQAFDVEPDSTYAENLRTLRNSVQGACESLLKALQSANVEEMRKAIKRTKNLSQLLEGESKDKVDDLARFTARAAGWLKDAVDEGEEALAKAVEETRDGASRFAGIVAELFAAEAPAAPDATAPAPIAAQA
jgi:virulence-associated protein VapD